VKIYGATGSVLNANQHLERQNLSEIDALFGQITEKLDEFEANYAN